MNLSWRDIRLDGLYDAPFDGQEVVKTTLRTRNIRATGYREAGLRVRDAGSGELSAALGAEFLPDQSGQLMVLVLAGDDEEPGLNQSQALDVLAAASAGDAIRQLGAGVLRFDRGLVTPGTSPELLEWLAQAVVRLLGVEAASLTDEALAGLLGVAYEPHEPGDVFERPVQFADEAWAGPVQSPATWDVGADEAPVEAAEPWAGYPEAEQASEAEADLWAAFDVAEREDEVQAEPWAASGEADEVTPETEPETLGEDQLEMIRLLTEDVEEDDALDEVLPVVPEAREELASIAREEVGDDAVDLLSDEDLAALIVALRGMGAELEGGEELPSLEGEHGPLPADSAAVQEWGAPTGEPPQAGPEPAPQAEADWIADYESLLRFEAEPEEVAEAGPEPVPEPEWPEGEVEGEPEPEWLEEGEVEDEPEPEWLEEGEVEATPEPEWIEPETRPELEPSPEAEWVEAEPLQAEPEPEWIDLVGDESPAGPELAPETPSQPDWIREGSAAFWADAAPAPEPAHAVEEEMPPAPTPEPQPEAGPAGGLFRAGPVPLADFARGPRQPAQMPAAEPPVGAAWGPDEARYEFPPRVEERSLAGKPREFYLCASCGEFSAEEVGENTYRCFRCRAVIEYRFGEGPRHALHP